MTFDFDIDRLTKAVRRFGQARVLVLGDVMLDKFIWGRVSRISPEAPVPVVEVDRESWMLGGAANVVHNLVALGAGARLCGLVGDDEAGRQVDDLLDDLEAPAGGIVVSASRPTTVKTRVVAHSQQVVRVDNERRRPADEAELAALRAYVETALPQVDAVVVSDYAKGVVCASLLGPLMEAARQGQKIVCVDPKVANMALYAGATIITPNHHEALAAAAVSPDDNDAVGKAGRALLEKLGARHVLVTQGDQGMTLFSPGERAHVPTWAKKVFDVTGAGDTVISTLALGLAVGLSPREAAVLANFAAGVVVGEVGTSVVTGPRLAQAVAEGAQVLGKEA